MISVVKKVHGKDIRASGQGQLTDSDVDEIETYINNRTKPSFVASTNHCLAAIAQETLEHSQFIVKVENGGVKAAHLSIPLANETAHQRQARTADLLEMQIWIDRQKNKVVNHLNQLIHATQIGERQPTDGDPIFATYAPHIPYIQKEVERLTTLRATIKAASSSYDTDNPPRDRAMIPRKRQEYRLLRKRDCLAIFLPIAHLYAPTLFKFASPPMRYCATIGDRKMKNFMIIRTADVCDDLCKFLINPAEQIATLNTREGGNYLKKGNFITPEVSRCPLDYG